MTRWISIKNQLPPQGVKIKIKAQYHDDVFVCAKAIFTIYDVDESTEAWGWAMSKEVIEKYGNLRPTHWATLPEAENDV